MKRALVLALIALAGCSRGGDENLGRGGKLQASADLRALAAPGELERALAVRPAEIARRLGPFRITAESRLALESGETRDTLDERLVVELDGAGGSRLVHEDGHGRGSEAIAARGAYYVRPRHGRFVQRRPEGDEVGAALAGAAEVLGGYLAVLGRFAARSPGATADRGGRPAIPVRLALAPVPAPFMDADPAHAWRATMEVSALEGALWLDAGTGAPLAAKLRAKYRARRGERTIAVELAYESELALGGVAPIEPPADALPSVARPRPLLDRQALLDGLATARRAPAPGAGE